MSSREPRPRPTRSCSCSSSNFPHWAHGLEGRQPLVTSHEWPLCCVLPHCPGDQSWNPQAAHRAHQPPQPHRTQTKRAPACQLCYVVHSTGRSFSAAPCWPAACPPRGLLPVPCSLRSSFPPPHAAPLPFPLSVHPSGLISTTPHQPSCLGLHCVPWCLPPACTVPGRWQLNTYLELGGSAG